MTIAAVCKHIALIKFAADHHAQSCGKDTMHSDDALQAQLGPARQRGTKRQHGLDGIDPKVDLSAVEPCASKTIKQHCRHRERLVGGHSGNLNAHESTCQRLQRHRTLECFTELQKWLHLE